MSIKDKIVENFIDLVQIDATSFNERKLADKLKQKLAELGIEAKEDAAGSVYGSECGNIYAVWEGDSQAEPVLLSAHMDTVTPGTNKKPIVNEEAGIIESDKTTVLGADDVSGIVEILDGIRMVKESGLSHRTVELLFPIAEEVYTKGATVFDYSKLNAKEAYCLDLSGDVGTAAYKAPSLISFSVTVIGKASHAGFAPSEGVNAILIAANAISEIAQGQVDDESTLNIGTIVGGDATNIVSERCVCKGEVRSFNHEKALKLVDGVKEKFETIAAGYGAGVEFDYEIHLVAYEVSQDSEVIKRFQNACENIGISGKLVKTLGGADNHQFNANGINGIVLSCGMEKVHTTDEYIKIENLIKGAELVKQIITAL